MKKLLLISFVLIGCSKEPEYKCVRCFLELDIVVDTCGYDVDYVYNYGNGVLVHDNDVMYCEYIK